MHLLNTLRPSLFQKQVLARIVGAATPKLAAAAIASSRNLMAARDMLVKLGAIAIMDDTAELTDKGMQLATDENIVDQSGGLTDVGTKLSTDAPPAPEPAEEQPQDDMGAPPPMPPAEQPAGDDLSLESFALLKEILR